MGSVVPKEDTIISNFINVQREGTAILSDKEAENGSDYPVKDLLSTQCLICDVELSTIIESSHNIFGHLRGSRTSCTRGTVFEKMGQVLSRSLHSIKLHSELICNKCFKLLIEHEEVKCRLQELQLDIEAKFNATVKAHMEEKQNGKDTSKRTEQQLCINESGSGADECSQGKNKVNQDETLLTRKKGEKKIRKKTKFARLGKPYVCSICGKTFRAFSHRVEHMLIHLDEKPWSCKECCKTFRTKSALHVHEAKHSGLRPYTCQHCNKSFLDRYYFEEHQRIHSGERPFACAFCSRLFARKKDLSIHTKSHTGDKPYKCSTCNKTFAVKSRLDRHMKIHSGERPYSCEHCTKSFARSDDYQVHLRTHTGERPFRCAICDRTFTNKSNCLVHVRLHQSSKYQHQCPVNKKTFKQNSNMNGHLKAQQYDKSESEAVGTSGDSAVGSQDQSVYLQPMEQVLDETQEMPSREDHSPFTQPLLQLEAVQNVTVTHIPPLQALPVTQVAQLDWGEIATAATATFVNITPGTYVSIM